MLVHKVLIVGGGIGGLGLAALLGRQGLHVEVVEARPDSTVLGVGINQPANSLRALQEVGVLDQCLAAGYSYSANSFFDWHGNPIVHCPSHLGGDDVPANSALTRADLKTILIGAAEEAHVKIRYGVTVEDLTDEHDRVLVATSDGASEFYDLVVAFDGINSGIRKRLWGKEFDPVFTGHSVWRLTMPRHPSVTHTLLFQGDGTKAGVIPLSEESMYLLHVTPEPGNPRHDPARFGELLTERLAGYTGLIGELRDTITGPEGIVYSPLSEVLLPAPWNKGRVVVLGDAAHACAPHLTQGAGMALEDAVVLAQELDRNDDYETAIEAFMHRRYDRVKLVQDVSHAILTGEMAVTEDTLPRAVAHLKEALPGQMQYIESTLNQPY